MKKISLAGRTFGKLAVISDAPSKRSSGGHSRRYSFCLCSCGCKTTVSNGHLTSGHTESCGCTNRTAEHGGAWRGGRYLNSAGYVFVWSPEHPLRNSKGYVFEHRLVMEKHLGRYLTKLEQVHHINEKKDDNRIENLQLCATNSEHRRLHFKLVKCTECGARQMAKGLCVNHYAKKYRRKRSVAVCARCGDALPFFSGKPSIICKRCRRNPLPCQCGSRAHAHGMCSKCLWQKVLRFTRGKPRAKSHSPD